MVLQGMSGLDLRVQDDNISVLSRRKVEEAHKRAHTLFFRKIPRNFPTPLLFTHWVRT